MANRRLILRAGLLVPTVAVLALLSACDRKEDEAPGAAAPAADTAGPAGANAPVTAAKGEKAPRVVTEIKAAAVVTAGSSGNQASVDQVVEGQYQWTILGGKGTDGADTPNFTYTVAPEARVVNLFCHVKGADGLDSTGFVHQAVTPMPTISAFEVRPAVTTLGTVAKLSWTASEFKTLVLDPGQQDVSSGVGITVQPNATTTYTLTAGNDAGAKATRTVTLKVVSAPKISSFGIDGVITTGQPLTLRAVFQDGRAEIKQGDTVLASSDQSPLSVQVTLGDQSSFALTVTNEAGASVTQTRTFQRSSGY